MGSERNKKRRGQMSEAWSTAVLLSASGGLQDAYTYITRGGVFANAQTGNVVLLSQGIFTGDWAAAAHYLVPILSFAMGVAAADTVGHRFKTAERLHWRQLVLLSEILLLFVVGFLPRSADMLANAVVSFCCAMQVQTFRKVNGYSFASTMCIGNLRSGVEALCAYARTKNRGVLAQAARYFSVILLFAVGAGIGGLCVPMLGRRTIWLSCLLLVICFGLMFLRDELDQEMP